MRQNIRRRLRNKARISSLKTQVRKFNDSLASKDPAAIEKELRATASLLDKTAAKGAIHRRTASRRRSRLARRMNAIKA